MEIIAQWFDDLEDLFAAVGLIKEHLRTFLITATLLGIFSIMQVAAVVLALRHPPIACAIATMLVVILMYRSATAPRAVIQQAG